MLRKKLHVYLLRLIELLIYLNVSAILIAIIIKNIIRRVFRVNLVDKLLKMDTAKITELPTADLEIKRLSELLGEPFIVKCRAIGGERYSEIQKMGVTLSKKGGLKDLDTAKTKVLTVIDGVVEPDLKREDLRKKFGAISPKELVYKMFLAGEIDDIYGTITDLCGYEEKDEDENEEKDEEIKN